jgi:hypothetical protein
MGNEVTVLSEKLQQVEREKNQLVDRYARYGDEVKQMATQEHNTYSKRIYQLKEKNKKLQEGQTKSDSFIQELQI